MKLSEAFELFDDDGGDSSTRNECLITRQEIRNEITLKCKHSFEYDALLKHLLSSQYHYDYHKCPYCRNVSSGFIPFYQNPDSEQSGGDLLNTINRSVYKKNDYITCSYCFVSGKNKGKICGKNGHKFNEGDYCFAHYKQITRQKPKSCSSKPKKPRCCQILNNGNQCKLKCFNDDNGLCKKHDKVVS